MSDDIECVEGHRDDYMVPDAESPNRKYSR